MPRAAAVLLVIAASLLAGCSHERLQSRCLVSRPPRLPLGGLLEVPAGDPRAARCMQSTPCDWGIEAAHPMLRSRAYTGSRLARADMGGPGPTCDDQPPELRAVVPGGEVAGWSAGEWGASAFLRHPSGQCQKVRLPSYDDRSERILGRTIYLAVLDAATVGDEAWLLTDPAVEGSGGSVWRLSATADAFVALPLVTLEDEPHILLADPVDKRKAWIILSDWLRTVSADGEVTTVHRFVRGSDWPWLRNARWMSPSELILAGMGFAVRLRSEAGRWHESWLLPRGGAL